ncbi:Ribonuclease Zc3h12a-like [Aphelenchoides avenae]|nr:Ribonuclease Zc3h12a-like [Aphelenchus avenae]
MTHANGSSQSTKENSIASTGNLPIRRMAIIDACNVMHACAPYNVTFDASSAPKPGPNALGIFSLVHSLLQADFDVMMYVPAVFMKDRSREHVEYSFVLKYLEPLCVTTIDDYSHDDLVLLEAARCFGGFVVSNDKFRDHHKKIPYMRRVIEERVVPYYIKKVNVDPRTLNTSQGRYFTGLEVTLKPESENAVLVAPDDPNFPKVLQHRLKRSRERTAKIRRELDTIADYLQQEFCLMLQVKPPRLTYFDPDDEVLSPTYDQFRKKVFRTSDSDNDSLIALW